MMKRIFCILLTLAMLTASSFALAEDAAAVTEAAETAETAAAAEEPVLLATINGQEIWSDNEYLTYMQSNYLNWASSNGYDTSNEALIMAINQQAMQETLAYNAILRKGSEMGLDQFTDEDKAAFEADAKAQWDNIVDSFVSGSGSVTDESTDEEKAAARAEMEAQLLALYGYDEARYTEEYVAQAYNNTVYQRVFNSLTENLTVTDEDIQAYYDGLVKEHQETLNGSAAAYEFYTRYYGQTFYYMPEGYRGITHILLKVDDDLLNSWKDLSSKLEEQQSSAASEPAETETPAEDAEPTAEPEPTEEPVTEEMVAAAEQAILDSVKETVDEIKAKLDAGASFDDLIKEYGTDSGMEDDATRAAGYPVHSDSIIYDETFKDTAMALEKVGDISDPVVTQFGVHILNYLRDIPGGAAELTEEMKKEFGETILTNLQNEALQTAAKQWLAESDIVYTEAGESWKMPEEDTDEAAAE